MQTYTHIHTCAHTGMHITYTYIYACTPHTCTNTHIRSSPLNSWSITHSETLPFKLSALLQLYCHVHFLRITSQDDSAPCRGQESHLGWHGPSNIWWSLVLGLTATAVRSAPPLVTPLTSLDCEGLHISTYCNSAFRHINIRTHFFPWNEFINYSKIVQLFNICIVYVYMSEWGGGQWRFSFFQKLQQKINTHNYSARYTPLIRTE